MVELCEKRARGDPMLPDVVIVSSRENDGEASPPLIGARIHRLLQITMFWRLSFECVCSIDELELIEPRNSFKD
ncbi:hypothetical protein NL676_029771 [Syzygium grande]|nr:hypothetical protein NL676_029771 [Syzygium grande]